MAEMRVSKWTYNNSGGGGAAATMGAISLGLSGGLLRLKSPTSSLIDFHYFVGTGSVGLGPPVSINFSTTENWSVGTVYLLNAFTGTELQTKDIEGICQIVDASVAGITGKYGAIMLLGMSAVGVVKDIIVDALGPKAIFKRVVYGPAKGVVELGQTIWNLYHADDSAPMIADWSSAKALIVMTGVMQGLGAGFSRSMGYLTAANVTADSLNIDLPITQEKRFDYVSREIRIILPADTLFDLNKDVIRRDADLALRKASETIKAQPVSLVILAGHTDDTGSHALNIGLSRRRAANVAERLSTYSGVDARKFVCFGFGKAKPSVPNVSAAARQKNRRVEITVYGTQKVVPA